MAITADAAVADLAAIVATVDPDVVQLNGREPVSIVASIGRPVWKVLHLPAEPPTDVPSAAARLAGSGRAYLAGGVERLLLDTAGGPHPGGTGQRASVALAAAVAREVPVTLAGGLTPANVAEALRDVAATGVDVASGVELPRDPGERPRKDPYLVALFAKRARAARDDRPNLAFGPTPIHAGLLEADAHGRWGMERDFGGRYVPETLMAALEQLEAAYDDLRQDPVFWSELRELLARFAGRPTALYRADRLAEAVRVEAVRLATATPAAGGRRRSAGTPIPGLRLYLKREDLAHTGAHKINNALGQSLLTRRLGKSRVIAETGAGQHGVATATACALLDLPCVVYMGAEDIERQGPNVLRMRALGAEVRSVTSGTATLKDAVNEAMRDWVTNVETTHYVLGSAMGPHPYPTIVRDLQRRIGDEAAAQLQAVEGRLPDAAIACVGGGSNAIGLLARFIGEPSVRLAVVEAAGDGIETGRHAAAILGGTPGILHGSRSLMLQDRDGQVVEAHSASAGLDYPGIGPQLAALAEGGRIEVASATDREAVAAMKTTTRTEGILPALETAHAIAASRSSSPARTARATRWPDETVVLVGFSGRWRQGPRGARALRRRRAVGGVGGCRRPRPGRPARTTPRAPGGSRRRSPARGPRVGPRSSRTSSRAIPTPRPACGSRSPRPTPGADLLEVGLPYSDPLADGATLQRASQVALGRARRSRASLRLIERIGAARPDLPLVPMGYANQVIGGGDGAGRRPAARRCRRGRVDRRRPDARRGRHRSRRSRATPASRSSTSSRRRRRATAAPRSPPAAAGSSTASRSSG